MQSPVYEATDIGQMGSIAQVNRFNYSSVIVCLQSMLTEFLVNDCCHLLLF